MLQQRDAIVFADHSTLLLSAGPARIRNLGANHAKRGRILVFLEGKVEPQADWLLELVLRLNVDYKRVLLPRLVLTK